VAERSRRKPSERKDPGERTVWVLDTETKGTGAEMVPLEKLRARRRSAPGGPPLSVLGPAPDPGLEVESGADEARGPRRFKLVNVITQQLLGEGVEAREAVELLRGVRNIVDLHIYVWEPDDDRWRPLSFAEKKAFWAFRDQ
jgi:hypothetical protein